MMGQMRLALTTSNGDSFDNFGVQPKPQALTEVFAVIHGKVDTREYGFSGNLSVAKNMEILTPGHHEDENPTPKAIT